MRFHLQFVLVLVRIMGHVMFSNEVAKGRADEVQFRGVRVHERYDESTEFSTNIAQQRKVPIVAVSRAAQISIHV